MTKTGENLKHYSGIIENQIKQWDLVGKQSETEKRKHPIITLSRDFGTHGSLLAEEVAQKLDFSFWDQDFVHAIAENTGLRESVIKSVDNNTRTRIDVQVFLSI